MYGTSRHENYYPRSEFDPKSAPKIGYPECPDPNPDSKILDPSKPNLNPDILVFRSGYLSF